jgi:hypothetical protein
MRTSHRRYVAGIAEMRDCCTVLVCRHYEKNSLGTRRRGSEDHTAMHL